MTVLHYALWFACIALCALFLQIIKKILPWHPGFVMRFLIAFVKALTASIIAFCTMAVDIPLFWNLSYIPAAIYAAVFCDACTDLAVLIIELLRKSPLPKKTLF